MYKTGKNVEGETNDLTPLMAKATISESPNVSSRNCCNVLADGVLLHINCLCMFLVWKMKRRWEMGVGRLRMDGFKLETR